MAVTYRASLRTTRMNDVVADIDSGAGAATVEIGTAGFATVIAIFTLSDPASSVAGDVLTCLGMPKTTVGINGGGVAAEARIKAFGGAIILSGLTVGTVGTNLIISPSTTIADAQTVNLTALTITHATT